MGDDNCKMSLLKHQFRDTLTNRPLSLSLLCRGRNLLEEYDFIVVGGGSAGCVAAARLSENRDVRVLLIEAGKRDSSPLVRIPGALWKVLGSAAATQYWAEPAPGTANRRTGVRQANLLGGGSSMNGMVYVRGQAEDYDHWAQLGNRGWSYQDVLPVFRRQESNVRLSGEHHGASGPLRVSDKAYGHPLSYAFIRAMQEIGIRYTDDFNGASQEGAGFFQTTTFQGRRWSAATAFLREAEKRPNLVVATETQALRIGFEDRRARSVVVRRKGASREIAARREIILAAGAMATPKLLMLSGIGPAGHLREVGIEVLHDLPGVGRNYQDHAQATVQAETRDPISLAGQDKGVAALRHLAQYGLFRTGLLSSNIVEAGAFVDSTGLGSVPDTQFGLFPVMINVGDEPPMDRHGLTISTAPLRPRSRGAITLRSGDPDQPIMLRAGTLEDPYDIETSIRAMRLAFRALRAPSLNVLIKSQIHPGPHVNDSDTALADYLRESCKTMFHPVGTAKMGTDNDPMAVVDEQLRVRGVEGLRVSDASIMPTLISGSTNAPTMMIAERCTDFISGIAD